MPENVTIKIKNELSELPGLIEQAHEFLSSSNVSSKALYALDLALEEMISNTIKYGYDDQDEHLITVNLNLDDTQIILTLIDDGHDFNPMNLHAPNLQEDISHRAVGGVGIYLTRELVDKMEHSREEGKNSLDIYINLL